MIFVDSSAFAAIENRRDVHHTAAVKFRDHCFKRREILITSDYVLDETYTLLRFRVSHAVAVSFGEAVTESQLLRMETISMDVLREAWLIFKTYHDQRFSFTDCTSFALMKHLGMDEVFTFDDDFRAFGKFTVMP